MTFVAAPLGSYEIVVGEGRFYNYFDQEATTGWAVLDLRLGFHSLWDDFARHHPRSWANSDHLPDSERRTRDEALEAGRALAEWHRERHLWWTPAL